MPKKYIDAEKLTEALREKCDGCKDEWTDYCTTCCDVVQLIDMIDNADDADVVERKKGKWIDRSAYCVCNLCGHTEQQFNGVEPIPRHTPFCATCGAEMEETDG